MSSRRDPRPAAEAALDTFPALRALKFVRHGFVGRIQGIDVATERDDVRHRLERVHRAARAKLGLAEDGFATAEQIHGNQVAVIDGPLQGERCFVRADGLITNQRGISLGIYVADCCAVFLFDPVRRSIGLIHSGKKGTALAIVSEAIAKMQQRFGTKPRDLIVQLSPCIRPPHYEVDFATEIIRQARTAGVEQVYDCGVCTACDLSRYYSYRAEKGRTGRMLAVIGLL
jgi:copper oxidase (laccase) domain-containing protein